MKKDKLPLIYRNKKTGGLYTALDIVINTANSNDGDQMVLYCRKGSFYVRELTEFCEKFEEYK